MHYDEIYLKYIYPFLVTVAYYCPAIAEDIKERWISHTKKQIKIKLEELWKA